MLIQHVDGKSEPVLGPARYDQVAAEFKKRVAEGIECDVLELWSSDGGIEKRHKRKLDASAPNDGGESEKPKTAPDDGGNKPKRGGAK